MRKIVIFIFCLLANGQIFALNFASVTNQTQKLVKTLGITSIEKTLIHRGELIKFSGKLVIKSKTDDLFFKNIKDGAGRSNIERMKQGLAPIGKDGHPIELHHIKQKDNGVLTELTRKEHQENSRTLHRYKGKGESEIKRMEFNKWKTQYWKERAKDFE